MSNTPSKAEIEKLAAEHLKAFAQFTGAGDVWVEGEVAFARAIEAEVRKQDDALILQLVEALEKIDTAMPFPVAHHAIAAGRARLQSKSITS